MTMTVASTGFGRNQPNARAKRGRGDGSVVPMQLPRPKVAGKAAQFAYVSTAGGAFLRRLEGRTLPGICALMQDKKV